MNGLPSMHGDDNDVDDEEEEKPAHDSRSGTMVKLPAHRMEIQNLPELPVQKGAEGEESAFKARAVSISYPNVKVCQKKIILFFGFSFNFCFELGILINYLNTYLNIL